MDFPPSSGGPKPRGGLERRDLPDEGVQPGGGESVSAESVPAGSSSAVSGSAGPGPIALSRLEQWFGVPLLIVGAIVCCAALVVVLFGGPASPPQRSLESLLQILEAGSGGGNTGSLPLREKELWQAALELSLRLEETDGELSSEQLSAVAVRLSALVEAEMESLQRRVTFDQGRFSQGGIRSRRLGFLIRGLGRTERVEALGPLLEVVRHGREPYLTAAIRELGNLHEIAGARRAIDPLVKIIQDSRRPETRLVACTALSVLAVRDDRQVIAALEATRLSSEGEVAWSAALALARLGSSKGRSTLLDLLDRSFLEEEGRYETLDETGRVRRYRLQPGRVDEILIAAITAAAILDDGEIRGRIEVLASDPSPAVSRRAAEVVDRGS